MISLVRSLGWNCLPMNLCTSAIINIETEREEWRGSDDPAIGATTQEQGSLGDISFIFLIKMLGEATKPE